jgi:hypothetical protein
MKYQLFGSRIYSVRDRAENRAPAPKCGTCGDKFGDIVWAVHPRFKPFEGQYAWICDGCFSALWKRGAIEDPSRQTPYPNQ